MHRVAWLILFVWGCQSSSEDTPYLEQSDVCSAYLGCVNETDASQVDDLLDTYGRNGSCWESEENAAQCDSTCELDLLSAFAEHPSVDACHPSRGEVEMPAGEDLIRQLRMVRLESVDGDCGYEDITQRFRIVRRDSGDLVARTTSGLFGDDTVTYDCEQDWHVIACEAHTARWMDDLGDYTFISAPAFVFDPTFESVEIGFAIQVTIDYLEIDLVTDCSHSFSGTMDL